MPTYEYECEACGHKFERFHSMTAAPIRKCPKCGKNKVKRLISTGAGMIFKGSGFYITDYRDASYSEKAKADSASGGAETKSDGKSETKDSKDAKEPKPDTKAGSDTGAAAKPAASDSPPPSSQEKKSEPKSSPNPEKRRKK
jgi:putative FmdB family regulatory protein